MAQREIAECPKCKRQMQEGLRLDRRDSLARSGEQIEGMRDYGWLGLQWVRKKPLPITVYRCPSCGYLEAYAK